VLKGYAETVFFREEVKRSLQVLEWLGTARFFRDDT